VCLQLKDAQNQREIERLEAEVRRLEGLRREQTNSISSLEKSMKSKTDSSDRKQETAANTISALTSELRTTKQALEDVTIREQQVNKLSHSAHAIYGDVSLLMVSPNEWHVRCSLYICRLFGVSTAAACAFELVGGQSGLLCVIVNGSWNRHFTGCFSISCALPNDKSTDISL
jgi:hypothetical protein